MAPRALWPTCRAAARVLLYVLAIVTLVIAPSVVLAGLFAWLWDAGSIAGNLSLGLVCSLIGWLFVAAFHLNREKLIVPVADPKTFLPQVRILLDEMGYETTAQTADTLTTRPRFNALLLGGGLRIQVQGNQAVVQGPKISAEILRSRLRVVHHLLRVQSLLQEERRSTEPLLKRVELCLRVKPEQLPAVQDRVLAPLAQSGEITCDLHVLVQSECGLRESTIEQNLVPWLRQHQIACHVHKHHARFHESQLHPETEEIALTVPG